MKDKILKLRKEGKTYNEIVDILGCSKGTISYHCGKGQKEKYSKRRKKYYQNEKYVLSKKIDNYLNRTDKYIKHKTRGKEHKELFNKFIQNPVCYLTGEIIDLSKTKTYSLDHIEPFFISKDNSIENAGLCTRDANKIKHDLSVKELIIMCNKIIAHNQRG